MATVATVGTFDGFHAGHRQLLGRLRCEAAARDAESLVLTFDTHPLAVVAPERVPPLLMSRAAVEAHIRAAGIDRIEVMHFTPEVAALTARQFMERLRSRYDATALLMGYDNSIGSDRPRTPEAYIAAARDAGIDILFDEPFVDPSTGLTPSSTLLRRLLAEGDIATYSRLAGEPFTLRGIVAHGRRNGHRLGFPTLNVVPETAMCIPAPGVYAGMVSVCGNEYRAVINVGNNPTIAAGNALTIEAHAIDIDLGDRYGTEVAVTFINLLRHEQRFDSLDQLRRAIAADIAAALTL